MMLDLVYRVSLSVYVYVRNREKYHWEISVNDKEGPIADGDEGTYKEAKEVGIIALTDFCHKEDPAHY